MQSPVRPRPPPLMACVPRRGASGSSRRTTTRPAPSSGCRPRRVTTVTGFVPVSASGFMQRPPRCGQPLSETGLDEGMDSIGTECACALRRVLVGALTTMVGVSVLGAGGAAADLTPQDSRLASRRRLTCATADPAKIGRLARPAGGRRGRHPPGCFYDLADATGPAATSERDGGQRLRHEPDLDSPVGTMPAGWNDGSARSGLQQLPGGAMEGRQRQRFVAGAGEL